MGWKSVLPELPVTGFNVAQARMALVDVYASLYMLLLSSTIVTRISPNMLLALCSGP